MKIRVYSTKTCIYCKMLRAWLDEKKIEFEDIDVGENAKAAKEMVEKSGQMGVPVTDIDGEIVVGFNKTALEEILKELSKMSEPNYESRKSKRDKIMKRKHRVYKRGGKFRDIEQKNKNKKFDVNL